MTAGLPITISNNIFTNNIYSASATAGKSSTDVLDLVRRHHCAKSSSSRSLMTSVDGVDFPAGLVRLRLGNVYVTPNQLLQLHGAHRHRPRRHPARHRCGVRQGHRKHPNRQSIRVACITAGKSITFVSGRQPRPGDDQRQPDAGRRRHAGVEINGTTPTFGAGTDFDQLVVNGTVDLGGATLDTTGSTITATPGDSIRIVDNDLTDSVSGTFFGMSNGDFRDGQPPAVPDLLRRRHRQRRGVDARWRPPADHRVCGRQLVQRAQRQ